MPKLIKISFLTCFFSTISLWGLGQNLVPNPSFEEFQTCPNSWATFNNNVLNWTGLPWGTPEAYNICGNTFDFGVPQNPYGYQFAQEGSSYAGIGFEFGVSAGDYREYLQVKLDDTLIAGNQYLVSFFVSKADSAPIVNTKIGAHLSISDVLNTLPNGVIDETPQIVSPPNFYIQDDVNWIEVSDTITAQGGELYLTLGYFETDSNADTLRLFHSTESQILTLGNGAEWTAYYYIDNVAVKRLDSTNSVSYIGSNESIGIYPNPAFNYFKVKVSKPFQSIELINRDGNSIKSFNSTECDISDLEEGFYFVKISFSDNKVKVQKLIITKN